jgi:hypothetical protein
MATAPGRASPIVSPSSSPVVFQRTERDDPVSATTAPLLAAAATQAAPAPLLVGAEPQPYNFIEKFKEANTFLSAGDANDKGSARLLFEEILGQLKTAKVGIHSVFQAACTLGYAFTYAANSPERTTLRLQAKGELDRIYINSASWDNLIDSEKMTTYSSLFRNYDLLLFLIPPADTATREDIRQKNEECRKRAMGLSHSVLVQANQLLHQRQNLPAIVLFKLVLENLAGDLKGIYSIDPAFCLLGIAFATPLSDAARKRWISTAKDKIYNLYANRSLWNTLGETEKARTYQALSLCFKQLAYLIPAAESQIQEEIRLALEECGKHFTPAPNPLENLQRAHQLLSRQVYGEAAALYLQTLELLKGELRGVISICPAACFLGLAFSTKNNPADKAKWTLKAQEELDRLYTNRASWNSLPRDEKAAAYGTLNDCLSRLLHLLIPETDILTIRATICKMRECRIALGLPPESPAAPSGPNTRTGGTPPGPPDDPRRKKVTPGPVGKPWNWYQIFAVCTVAVVALGLGLGLYKRFIVKK